MGTDLVVFGNQAWSAGPDQSTGSPAFSASMDRTVSACSHTPDMGGDAARPVLEFLQSLKDADSESPVPLKDTEANALAGTYQFGTDDTHEVEVNADMKMYAGKMYTYPPQLNWTRKGTMTRALFHLGNFTFYPTGAPAVRIRFAVDRDGVNMTVNDGDFAFSATRKQSKFVNQQMRATANGHFARC